MLALKFLLVIVLVATASSRYVQFEDQGYPLTFDDGRHLAFDEEDPILDHEYESYHPRYLVGGRVRRQAEGSVSLNSNGGVGLSGKIPIAGGEKNQFSAVGSYGLNDKMQPASHGIGIQLDNVNGHSLSVMKDTMPGFGDSLTAAGKLKVFHNDNHDVSARGFVSKNMPDFPNAPNFHTVGGGVDYMYKNKVGASLGMASTPFLDRKEYSAMGNLNLFRNPTSSVDLSAGFRKFDAPMMRSNWEPNFGLTYSRTFPTRF